MHIDQHHELAFVSDGWTSIPEALPPELIRRSDACVRRLYDEGPQHDGITQLPDHPGLDALLMEPRLERIAERILSAPVVLNGGAILFKRPQPDRPFSLGREHVDVMYTREEWQSHPRRVMCMLMVLLADLPEGRGNTWIRPGSHLQIADWLQREGRAPTRAHPTKREDLPDLPWQEPQPVTGRAGDVIAFNTNLLHCPSSNTDSEPRRIMFINFCPRGMRGECSGNHDKREQRKAWRERLRARFADDRQYLLDGEELAAVTVGSEVGVDGR